MNSLTPFLKLSFFRSIMVLSLIGNAACIYAESTDEYMTDELAQEIRRNLQHRSQISSSVNKHMDELYVLNEKLDSAIRNDDLDGVKAAIKEGANVNLLKYTLPLKQAIRNNKDTKILDFLLKNGAKPDNLDPSDDKTPLITDLTQ